MPGWGWVILALVMIGGVAYGLVYAYRHLRSAVHMGGMFATALDKRLGRMADAKAAPRRPKDPAFTQPFSATMERYAEAQAQIEERHDRKRDRHVKTWADWSQFNA